MRAVRKYFQRSPAERRLLRKALVVVPLIRIALWLLPFRVVHRVIRRTARPSVSPAEPAERIVRAVSAVSARVPRATCLTQALAVSLMLLRHGHDATLRIGVAKDDDGRLRAHAWVESGGAAILGEPEPGAFHALPPVALS